MQNAHILTTLSPLKPLASDPGKAISVQNSTTSLAATGLPEDFSTLLTALADQAILPQTEATSGLQTAQAANGSASGAPLPMAAPTEKGVQPGLPKPLPGLQMLALSQQEPPAPGTPVLPGPQPAAEPLSQISTGEPWAPTSSETGNPAAAKTAVAAAAPAQPDGFVAPPAAPEPGDQHALSQDIAPSGELSRPDAADKPPADHSAWPDAQPQQKSQPGGASSLSYGRVPQETVEPAAPNGGSETKGSEPQGQIQGAPAPAQTPVTEKPVSPADAPPGAQPVQKPVRNPIGMDGTANAHNAGIALAPQKSVSGPQPGGKPAGQAARSAASPADSTGADLPDGRADLSEAFAEPAQPLKAKDTPNIIRTQPNGQQAGQQSGPAAAAPSDAPSVPAAQTRPAPAMPQANGTVQTDAGGPSPASDQPAATAPPSASLDRLMPTPAPFAVGQADPMARPGMLSAAPAGQPVSVPAQTASQDIAIHMARNLETGQRQFELRLDPPELGRIDIRMEITEDGRVQARLIADKPEALDLLRNDARALERALNESGLKTDSGSLNFSLRDQAGQGAHDRPRGQTGDETFALTMEDAAPAEDGTDAEAPPEDIYGMRMTRRRGVDLKI